MLLSLFFTMMYHIKNFSGLGVAVWYDQWYDL